MLISKIRLSNFKNFEDVEVDLGKMNVFVGANASGKSNFLQALKFIRDIKDFGIENAISLQGGVEYLRNVNLKKRKNTQISLDYQTVNNKLFYIFRNKAKKQHTFLQYDKIRYSIIISKNKLDYKINEEIEYGVKVYISKSLDNSNEEYIGNCIFNFKSSDGFIKLDYGNGSKVEFKTEHGDLIEFDKTVINPAHTILHKIIFATDIDKRSNTPLLDYFITSLLFNYQNLSLYDFDLKNIKKPASIIGKADLEENGENLSIVLKHILEDKEKARQFSNLLSDILPFIKGIETEKYFDKSLSFKVKEAYNNSNVVIPSSLLSDGTISITAILTALFFQENRLAIFEEPEHGVHPALIAKLMQFFYEASEKKQIIITTHSPEILKHTKLEDLRLVTREEDGFGKIIKPAEQEMVKAFLENELGIEQLFTQNLLDR